MPPPATTETQQIVPLCVDLDGTLIKTDLLWESLVRLLKRRPHYIFALPIWLLSGRARLKAEIAKRVEVEPVSLPYNQALIDFLREEKSQGRPVILVTASDSRAAQSVADHLRLFSEVLASDGKTNLRGKNKGARLAERFGAHGFDYAGNSIVDLPVWEQARQALVVNASSGLPERAGRIATLGKAFQPRKSWFEAFGRSLRVHQWVKNLIIFVPLLTSHKITDFALAIKTLLTFVAFSLCASGVYLLNDVLDVEADRHHPTKRLRPFAAGDLPLPFGLIGFPVLLLFSALIGVKLSMSFLAVLGMYVAITTSYSWWLKRVVLVDVFCLTGLYTVRLIAGHEATRAGGKLAIDYSFWLLVFSLFIFLSLALVKRFLELKEARSRSITDIKGRGYLAGDAELVASLGSGSGFLAVLVLALYVNSPEVIKLYAHPLLLLLICPLLLYWISRVWLIAHRGQMHEDPIVFALKDPVSYVVAALALVFLWLAT